MTSHKIQKTHLERQAVIYIRQSSPLQVETNVESKRRQYQLVEQVQTLGWHETQCTVIDDDQAISGAQSYNRPGFQQVISMMALREVGIILGLEVARLARNCLDWYQLLELAGVFDVLVADEDGVYDLRDFNDRFLLGMKGVFAEVELYQIRSRLERARRSKAQRGELQIQMPIGLEWDEATNKPRLAVDESIRQALTQVFRLFRQLRTARGVLNYLYQTGAELPYQHQSREQGRILGWRRPHYEMIYAILTNPLYAKSRWIRFIRLPMCASCHATSGRSFCPTIIQGISHWTSSKTINAFWRTMPPVSPATEERRGPVPPYCRGWCFANTVGSGCGYGIEMVNPTTRATKRASIMVSRSAIMPMRSGSMRWWSSCS
jgi:DNA invertase Pin-like site-specific DNA recombinase